MVDILGPADAVGAVTTRPAETRSFGANDSWFIDCSSPSVEDGTDIAAAFLNGLVASLRALYRANGTLLDGITPVVSEIAGGDLAIMRAVQHLIQRGQSCYGQDTSPTANTVIAALTPAPPEYRAGMVVHIVMANPPTGPSVISLNGLGNRPIVKGGGAQLTGFEWSAGDIVTLRCDGGRFQMTNVPVILTAPRNYYVNAATGSDANNGLTPGGAFATIQRAVAASQSFNLNGYSVTINVANGTYTGPVDLPLLNGSGGVNLVGNPGAPSSCSVTSTTGSAFRCSGGGYSANGFNVSCTNTSGGDPGNGVWVEGGGVLVLQNMEYGNCVGNHILASDGGFISFTGNDIINGSAQTHITAGVGAKVILDPVNPPSLSVLAAVAFSLAFVSGANLGVVSGKYGAVSISGSVAGTKYYVIGNGIVNSNGSGVNYFPGTGAGITGSGGQYL